MVAVQITLLLTIGYAAITIDRWQKNFPLPVFLVLVGIGLSFIPYFSNMSVSKDVIYDVFLPGLLFVSAYQYSAKALSTHKGVIGTLSTIGLILTAMALGGFVYAFGGLFISITFVGALLFASILTPTDPVSVVSILRQSTDDPAISQIVDGESMINDGTSVVLFGVFLGMFTNGTSFHLLSFFGDFLYVSIGGAGLGLLIGWLFSKALHLAPQKENQVLLSIVIAYGVFHLAEFFGFSGVLATVSAGVMLSAELERTANEKEYRTALNGFWEVIEPALLSLLFLLIGITSAKYLLFDHWILAVIIFLVSVFIRFLVISGTMQVFDGLKQRISFSDAFLLSWSGIRGTMSVFLLLSLEAEANGDADLIVSLGFAVVLLSLVFQSIGIYPLSRRLTQR
ncbi:cation:proton antiporter [Sporosarcina aquimarina]|uniref:Cation:proton antiporter n=1 Tax=Sporosarcina aquimarina TaxID=114975 RepID=A0ABU4G0F7_9BACL|nr:cation:proton antiporter [Sporosarcina aquimarina]MDW0109877.1 cation:proton antiporter [Sporosarcina aquimarina]